MDKLIGGICCYLHLALVLQIPANRHVQISPCAYNLYEIKTGTPWLIVSHVLSTVIKSGTHAQRSLAAGALRLFMRSHTVQ